jgi:CheY-like chemotaxis protein
MTMGAKRVLLVDDDVDFLEINRMTLERAGFEVLTADTAGEGLKTALSTSVDVAVLDVMMDTPTEGFELARKLRAQEQTKHLPLLMLTSINTENEAIGSFVRFSDRDRDQTWLPVDRFVDKPIKPEDLISLVRTLAGAWTFSHK